MSLAHDLKFFGKFRREFALICREEQVFDREEVLGRDAKSVFPTESKTPALDTEAVKAALGSNLRFITETEVTNSFTIANSY